MTKAEYFRSFLYFFAVFLAAACGAIIVYDKSIEALDDSYAYSSVARADGSRGARLQITVDSPFHGEIIKSPLNFYGTASGTWFVEGNFPVKITDKKGNLLGSGVAKAEGNYDTVDKVAFKGVVTFSPIGDSGFIVFEENDPKGVGKAGAFKIPILFK